MEKREIPKTDPSDQIIIALDPELKMDFKITCIRNKTSMSAVLTKCIKNYLAESRRAS